MKILITGSNGIIGQQLLAELLKSYPFAEFVLINRKPSMVIEKRKIESIEIDLLTTTIKQIEPVFERTRPELFFHLAWDTSHGDYLTTLDNTKWEKISILLINNFYKAGGKKFIGIGSSIEYNWNHESPFDEKISPLGGNKWLYAQSKLNVFKYLSDQKNISYLWCRVFFVFGPHQSKLRLLPLIINNALFDGQPLSLNLKLKRDYISTFEIARQIVMMQKTDYSGAVNICSGRAVEIKYIVDCIAGITKSPVRLSPVTYQDGFEIECLSGSTELINQYYKDYSYSLDDFYSDIKKTIRCYQV